MTAPRLSTTVVQRIRRHSGSCFCASIGALVSMSACPSAPRADSGRVASGPVALRVAEVGTSNIAGTSLAKRLPLVVVGDVALPGGASRFDYQDVDPRLGHLVIAHMGDGSVLFVRLSDGAVLRELTGIRTPRGVAVAAEVGLVFVTSMPNQLVIIDGKAMREIRRVGTGAGPDGVAWDGMHKVVGVSNQRDGTLSLIHDAGQGAHAQVRLGSETGNVMFDATRGWFWVTVNTESQPDTLVAVNPTTAAIETTIKLPSCNGAHGLRLHPDAASAYVACESNSVLTRVDLRGKHAISTAPTGEDPDVMSLDPQIGWLYVAAESGELTVFDMNRPGVALIGHDRPFAHAHTVAADPTTHRVFFPLAAGPKGTPVLRIMQPSGL